MEEEGKKPTAGQGSTLLMLAGFLVVVAVVAVMMNGVNERVASLDDKVSALTGMLLGGQPAAEDNTAGTLKKAEPKETGSSGGEAVQIDLSDRASKGTGDILIVEYSDFQCPFCSRATQTVEQVIEEYGDSVKLYYKHFPLSQIHQNAQKAAEASECANDQGKFWEYHDKLFGNQNALDTASLKEYAGELGLDRGEFGACLDSGEKENLVKADMQEGVNLGVQGTPTFFINGKALVGAQPFSAFKEAIEQELEGQ